MAKKISLYQLVQVAGHIGTLVEYHKDDLVIVRCHDQFDIVAPLSHCTPVLGQA